MRTVQMTLDESLVLAIDKAAKRLGTTRSGFTRDALRSALEHLRIKGQEQKQREGYRKKPVKPNEFRMWQSEQVWRE